MNVIDIIAFPVQVLGDLKTMPSALALLFMCLSCFQMLVSAYEPPKEVPGGWPGGKAPSYTQKYEWYRDPPDKQIDVTLFRHTIQLARDDTAYNDTTLCISPIPNGGHFLPHQFDEIWGYEESKIVFCDTRLSIRLMNHISISGKDEDVRILRKQVIDIADELVAKIEEDWKGIQDKPPGEYKPRYLFPRPDDKHQEKIHDNEHYEAVGLSWFDDFPDTKFWAVMLGYEKEGCPKPDSGHWATFVDEAVAYHDE